MMRSLLALIVTSVAGVACAQPETSSLFTRLHTASHRLYLSYPDSAIALGLMGIEAAEKTKQPSEEALSCYLLSKAHWVKTNYRLSTEYGLRALRIFEQQRDTLQWGSTLLGLGRNFIDLGDYDQARTLIYQANRLASVFSDSLLAEAYRERSFLHQRERSYDSALYYIERGLTLFAKYNDTLSISILYSRKARVLFAQKQFEIASQFNEEALHLDSAMHNTRALGVSLLLAAEIAMAQNKLPLALARVRQSLVVTGGIGNLDALIRGYEVEREIYERQRQTEKALQLAKLISQLKDSLFSIEKNGQVLELQTLYQLESKERTIQMLEQENELERQTARNRLLINIFLVIGLLLLGAVVYVMWRMRQFQKKANLELALKNQDIELQNEEIQSQAESLHEINKLKSKILSVVSHDLRSPIANLQSLLELFNQQHLSVEEFRDLSGKLKSNLSVTQRTLENLLNWSLGQMEGIRTDRSVFNIHSIIEDVTHLNEETALRKQVTIKRNFKTPVFVEADVNQIHLVLRNLVHNAIKFSQRDNEVDISTELRDKHCHVIIKDEGIGMTQAEIDMVMVRNEYFTKSGTDQEKGTGLGLLLCKDFVKRNGGEFFIKSTKGKGTTVTFTLPVA